MITKESRAAHDIVDEALSNLESYLFAIWSLAHESPSIDHSAADARAIMAVLHAAENAVKQATAGQARAWEALGGQTYRQEVVA